MRRWLVLALAVALAVWFGYSLGDTNARAELARTDGYGGGVLWAESHWSSWVLRGDPEGRRRAETGLTIYREFYPMLREIAVRRSMLPTPDERAALD